MLQTIAKDYFCNVRRYILRDLYYKRGGGDAAKIFVFPIQIQIITTDSNMGKVSSLTPLKNNKRNTNIN